MAYTVVEQRDRLNTILAASDRFLGTEVVEVATGLAVTVTTPDDMSPGERGALLMEVEAYLREQGGEDFVIFMAPRQDKNKARRNISVRLKAWEERRDEAKQRAR